MPARELGPVVQQLRTELEALAASSGRTPTATEAFLLVRKQGLSRADLETVLEMLQQEPPAGALGQPALTPTEPSVELPSTSRADHRPLASPPADAEFDEWDLFSSAADPDDAKIQVSDDVVGGVLDDLVDDWRRTDGLLTRDEVQLLGSRRGLSVEQQAEVFVALDERGIDLVEQGESLEERRQTRVPADDVLGAYLRAAGNYPLIGAQEEVRLGTLIQAGLQAKQLMDDPVQWGVLSGPARVTAAASKRRGVVAHAELVRANLRLVVSIARHRRYDSAGVELIDRIQDGNLGLMHAANRFDPHLGFKFSTYATWWIRQQIERGIADKGRAIRVPVHVHEDALKLKRRHRGLLDHLKREPLVGELAEATGFTEAKVALLLEWQQPVSSLDAVIVAEGDLTRGDLLSGNADVDGRRDPWEVALESARLRDLKRVLTAVLTEKEHAILKRRFGLDGAKEETLAAIAADFDLTRERIRQLERKALDHLRRAAEAEGLFEYLVDQARGERVHPQKEGTDKVSQSRRKTAGAASDAASDPRKPTRPKDEE